MLSSAPPKEDLEIWDVIYDYCDRSDSGYYVSSPGLLKHLREKGYDIVKKQKMEDPLLECLATGF